MSEAKRDKWYYVTVIIDAVIAALALLYIGKVI